MKKRMIIMLSVLSIIFGGIIFFNFFMQYMMQRFFAHFTPPAVSVATVTAMERNWQQRINTVGDFVAINGVELSSEAAGIVTAIHFNSGQYAEAGTALIDIDDSIDQATLKSKKSELVLQTINYKRQTDLFKRGATSSSGVDEAQAKLLQAEADVEKIEAAIAQKHIHAPFAGQLGIRNVDLGQYITPGQTEIASLQSTDPMYLIFYLPEHLISHIHLNQKLNFTIEQNPNLIFSAKITALNSKIDPRTHNIQVQATLANCPRAAIEARDLSLITIKKEEGSMRNLIYCDSALNKNHKVDSFYFVPGMFADIELIQPSIAHSIVLPSTAISYSLYGDAVYLVEPDKLDKKSLVARRTFIKTGDKQGNYTVIRHGVSAGAQVVSSGELKLQDGTRVIINNEVQLKDAKNSAELGQ